MNSFMDDTKGYINTITSFLKKYKLDLKLKGTWNWIKQEFHKQIMFKKIKLRKAFRRHYGSAGKKYYKAFLRFNKYNKKKGKL